MSAVQQMLVGAGGGAGAACDPYFGYVSLLLHMDGTNGSTTFTDNSLSPKTLTPSGNAQVNTSVVKYGTGSYVGDGSGDYLTATVPGGLGASDFTIEYWMYLTADTGYLFNSRTSGTSSDGIDIAVRAQVSTSGSNIFGQYGGFALNTWIYVAIVRQGSTWYRFFNGTLYDTASNSGNFTGTDFKIGGSPHGNVGYINGYIDDFRITKGVARYTANFTPPAAAFPDIVCAVGGAALYWRIDTISLASFLEISEVQFFNGASRLIGTMTSSVPPDGSDGPGISVERLNDNDLATRAYWLGSYSPTLWIALQLGTPTQVTSVKLGAYDNSDRYPTAFTLKKSNDGVTWTTVGSVSGLTYPGNLTLSAAIPF